MLPPSQPTEYINMPGYKRRDHVPGLPGQEAELFVLHLGIGVPQQDGRLVLGREHVVLEVDFHLAAALGRS